jgi:outer membrane protein OmpA-like peptidoglycan-associated protein
MNYQKYIKSEYLNLGLDEIKISPLSVLNGVSQKMADSLKSLNIFTVYDLAYSAIFSNADILTNTSNSINNFMKNELIPSDVMDGGAKFENIANAKFEDIQALKGIGSENVVSIKKELNINTIYDMANWPQYIAAREIVGLMDGKQNILDEEIPKELIPTFNEYAVDKSFYTIYTIDSKNDKTGNDLETAVKIDDVINPKSPIKEKIRTGQMLRYEQSWTPIGMGLGNLLHSLALAPGESTRVAIVDWRRSQGVRTTEAISQLESLANTIVQNRSISEITNSVAREAQSGFSEMNSNTSITNNAVSNYGIQNMGETLSAVAAGAYMGAGAGAGAGALAGGGIGFVAGSAAAGIGAVPGLLAGAAIGAGSGAIIGGTAGGVGAFLTSADFGASQENKSSLENVTATTTSSEGVKEVSANMAQNIMDRTHQYSSSSRNRRASIVQELSQSESENISTRVVTNYNHMHSLTIQYFEVVQMYRVTTSLKSSQPCLFIPFKPINNWTKELVAEFRKEIIQSALHSSVLYMFELGENVSMLSSPSIEGFRNDELPRLIRQEINTSIKKLKKARMLTNSWISNNPINSWCLPKTLYLRIVWDPTERFFGWNIGGLKAKLVIYTADGNVYYPWNYEPGFFPHTDKMMVKNIRSIILEIDSSAIDDWNWKDHMTNWDQSYFGMEFIFTEKPDADFDLQSNTEAFSFKSYYRHHISQIDGNKLITPLLVFASTPSYKELIEHLNQNTEYYSKQILKKKNPKLIRNILNNFDFQGDVLSNLVDSDPVAISDNKLIFSLKKALGKISAIDLPEKVLKSDLIPVATEGVFAEAIQGRANSAEKLDISRFWNWQDSPIPIVAPEISPIQAGSRATAADIRPGSLDASLVANIQPNALPAPGTGTAAILNAISSVMFRDMSGIMQTAQLAQSALEQAQAGATSAGGQSAASLKNGLELTKDLVGKIIKMNSDYATLLASTGFGALAQGNLSLPSGRTSNRQTGSGAGTTSTPMTDPNANISNAGAALNAMKDADKKHLMTVPGLGDEVRGGGGIPGSGGDIPSPSVFNSGSSDSLYEQGLRAMMGDRNTSYTKALSETTETETPPGISNIEMIDNLIRGRVLFSNFVVNDSKLTDEHKTGLDQFVDACKNNVAYRIELIEGRASQTGDESNNETLSLERSNAVAQYLIENGIVAENIGAITGYGSSRPLRDREGIELEINRSVMISWTIWIDLPEKVKFSPTPKEQGSNNWGIRFNVSGGASHVGIGGTFAVGELINFDTGKRRSISFQGAGLGISTIVSTPGASPSADYQRFTTDKPYLFEDFDGTLARLDMAGAGILFVGYTVAFLHLPNLGANAIYVGGMNMGSVGADASRNVGWLNVIGN